MERGEIYYIKITQATGHEMRKSRPGVIVSANAALDKAEVVQVVLCSGSSEHGIETHVPLRNTPIPSCAMCEHLYTVDKSRIGNFMGRCTEGELAVIDNALRLVLGLRK